MCVFFFFQFVYMVDYIDRFSYVDLSLHLWDEVYLFMVDDFFASRRMQIDSCLSPCTKLKFKKIKVLKIRQLTLKLKEEKVWSKFEHMSTGEHFLNITLEAETLISIIIKWDLLKPKSFSEVEDKVNKVKWQPTEWEKTSSNLKIWQSTDI